MVKLNVTTPTVSKAFDEDLIQKKRAVAVQQGVKAVLKLPVLGTDGLPINLNEATAAVEDGGSFSLTSAVGGVKVRFREALSGRQYGEEVTATITDGDNGEIEFSVPPGVMSEPAIYLACIGIFDVGDSLIHYSELYVMVENSAWGSGIAKGPPQLADIRLSLRDSDPFESELLANFQYDLVEVCHAAVRAVAFWNAQPPSLACANFTTLSFPDREIWLIGIHLFLFEMAEEYYRKNSLPYSASGLQVDDMSRHQQYSAAWQQRFQKFKELIQHTKAQINMGQLYGGLGSRYPWRH